jgi:tetratricopeptide (TPR) repeat protein
MPNQAADSTFNHQGQFVSGSQTNIASTGDGLLMLTGDHHQITLSGSGALTFHLLDDYFRNVQRDRAPASFYDGARPNWANIAQGHDAKRHLYQRLRSFVEAQHLPAQRMGLLLGLAGEGKTTLLMRLAWDLAEAGWPVLWRHSGKVFRSPTPNFQRTYDRPLLLCFDQADDETDLPTLAAELAEYGVSFVILATARFHEWRSAEMDTKLSRCLRLQHFGLERLTEDEVSSLLDLLAANEQLGNLYSLSRSDQISHFINRLQADGQLLPALLVARRGAQSFSAVVEDVLQNLRKRPDGELLCTAHITLSAVHRFGFGLPRTALSPILGIDPRFLVQRVLGPLTGELIEIVGSDKDQLYTRHSLLAEYVVKRSVLNNWCDLSFIYQNIFDGLGIMLRHAPFESSPRNLLTSLARKLKFAEPRLIPTLLKNMVTRPILPGDASADAVLYETWGVIGRSIGEYDKARQLFTKAERLDASRPSLWQAWGVLEERVANAAKARELFQKGIKIDPTHAPTWQAWGRLEQRQGNIIKARELLQQGIQTNPTDPVLLQTLALLEQRQGNSEKARVLFQQGTEAEPTHAYTWQAWGLLEEKQSNIDRARELFQRGTEADPTHAYAWQAWGLLEEKQGNIDRARELFQKSTEADPTDAHCWQAWGLLEQKQGNIDRSREFFQRGTEADPTDAHCWQAWGLLEEKQGNIDKARELFQRGTETAPASAHCWQAWGLLEEKQGNIDRARELFQRGTEAAPASAYCWQAWSLLEQEQGNIDRARELLQQGIENSPTEPALWRTLVRIGLHQGNEKTWKLFQQVIAADPTNAQLWHVLALLEQRQGNIDKARELFQRCTEADPTDVYIWHQWIMLEMRQHQNFLYPQKIAEEALRYLERKQDRALILCDLARISIKLQDYDQADKLYKESLALNPQNEKTHYFYADKLLTRRGRLNEACYHYQQALSRTHDQREKERIRNALERLGCSQ